MFNVLVVFGEQFSRPKVSEKLGTPAGGANAAATALPVLDRGLSVTHVCLALSQPSLFIGNSQRT
jgi:hypothetical protein